MTVDHEHLNETVEHGTPFDIVNAVWEVLGTIDLDPASCARANAFIEAAAYYDQITNGYNKEWFGNVFLNPPGGTCELETGRMVFKKTKKRESCSVTGACGIAPGHKHKNVGSSATAWWRKLLREFQEGRVHAAIFLGFSLEILQTTQVEEGILSPLDFSLCIPRTRLDFIRLEEAKIAVGGAPPHASFLCYLGAENELFKRVFSRFGKVL